MKFKFSTSMVCLINALLCWCFAIPLQIGNAPKISGENISKTCLEPKTSGLCRGKFLRYAYDDKSHSCVSFYYSGCGATHNNFLTYEECRRECIPQLRY